MLDTCIGKRPVTKDSRDGAIAKIEKVCIEVLKASEKIPKVGMTLCLLRSVLEIFSKMRDNKSECLEVLRRMLNLAKQILQSNEQIPEQKPKLNEGIQCIVVRTSMCISQLARGNIFRFLTATVNADLAFQLKIDRLYTYTQLAAAIDIGESATDIGERVPMIASQSQKIYAYQPIGGIEKAQESLFQLLDLNAQDTIPTLVVGYGFGGIGKNILTLADAVYVHLGLQSYKHCRIHMDQDCTNNDLKGLEQQILYGLFKVNFLLKRLLEPVQEAFLDITSYFYDWSSKTVAVIVGEEEFRALEAASFVNIGILFIKTSEYAKLIVHGIVQARGKKLSEQEGNIIRDPETSLECLKDEEKLKNLKGIYFDEEYEQLPVKINCHHLNCMSNSLKVLHYGGSQITFWVKCHKPFEQLRCLKITSDVPALPMDFEKLEHITYYEGPLTQGMNLYESEEKTHRGPNSAVASYIHDGQKILEMLDTCIGKRPKNSRDGAIAEIEKVCIEVLRGSEKIPKVGMALSLLGSVLERFSKICDNKSECLEVSRRMLNLAKQIHQLNE